MASSRLKRKIETADEGQYGNLNESFVSVGTALPALTEYKKDKNEFKPVWQQEVYDDQGRRRFHGAFTGGFSAGYFNTVGSKEGWTPSTFKSSRSNRASQNQRSVLDAAKEFMDDEDLAELASSRTLETSSTYASSSRAPAPPPPTYDPLLGNFAGLEGTAAPTPNFDDTLASLIQPSSSRIGLKLMRKMGWRDGQGVGPRVTYQQRKRQAADIGVKLDEEDDIGGEAEKHLYAPLDRPLTLIKGTSASMDKGWGLGYQPGMNLQQQLRSEGGYAGQASGRQTVYELDVDDVYGGVGTSMDALGDRQKRALGVYDGEDDADFGTIQPSRGARTREQPKKRGGPLQECHDGTKVLPGFVLQTEPLVGPSLSQLPPQPPPGWQPNPSRLWKENQPPATDAKGKGRQLDADERGSLLGEQLPPPVPKSVFHYLSAKSRERLAAVTGAAPSTSASATPDAPPPPPEPDAQLFVPPIDRPTASAALRGFQPYSAASTSPDPIKQARYTLYLQYQSSGEASTTSSPFGPRQLPNGKMQSVAELNRELSEYAQAATVFKPVSGMLGNRFQSSKTAALDVPKVEPGLYQPPPKSTAAPSTSDLAATYGDASASPPKPPELAPTPAQQAARAGNFGPLTRTSTPFRPARLLCKRFGVRDPYENAEVEENGVGGKWGEATSSGWGTGNAQTSQPIGRSALDEMMQSAGFKRFQEASKEVEADAPEVVKGVFETPAEGSTVSAPKTKPKVRPTLETVGYGDDESQGQEIVDEQKAPPDIFAAIFADSDDEDESDDEAEPAVSATSAPAPATTVLSVDKVETPAAAPTAAPAPAPPSEQSPTTLSLDTIATYKPTFAPSTSRTTSSSKPEKKKKAKRKSGALSFAMDEDGEDGDTSLSSSKKSKRDKDERDRKRRRDGGEREESRRSSDKRRQDESGTKVAAEEEDEWAEAPSQVHPDVLAAMQKTSPAAVSRPLAEESKVPKTRPRAADLY
ncbi:G patch domain-containing protein 1 [Rhodotorula toruloides]|nr:G patch domain-containing protein 1 [Rhodotorula toruloides]